MKAPRLVWALPDSAGGVEWSPDGSCLAAGSSDGRVSTWGVDKGVNVAMVRVHEDRVNRLRWSADGLMLVSCSDDRTICVLRGDDLQLVHRLSGHARHVWDITLSPDDKVIASVSSDDTVRIWDVETGGEIHILENSINPCSACFSPDGEFLAVLQQDSLRLWRCRDWTCVAAKTIGENYGIGGLGFHPTEPLLAVKDQQAHRIYLYQVSYNQLRRASAQPGIRHYINAKVILLGDTGVGKSGLGLVLSRQPYRPTDSTHGRNVWMFDSREVEVEGGGKQNREVILWDLAGQPGYRLVHQLHLNEVAVALLVFDSRSETDPFSGVKHWVRALAQSRRLEGAAAVPLQAFLVAARADRTGVAVTKGRIQAVLDDLGLDGFFETSAKEGWHIEELTQAIHDGIAWEALPSVSSSVLFDSIKQFLLEEKQQGRLLSTAEDLYLGYRRAQPDSADDAELRLSFEACIGRVESRGLIRRLHFGDLVLLQPELLDAYASAIVQAAKDEPDGLGFLPEEEALKGRFRLAESERIKNRAQEKLLLISTVEELLRHEVALKETTDRGVDLVFPSQLTRERPDAPNIPGQQVIFTFDGPLLSIYATLAVRLSRSVLFRRRDMWQNAASFTASGGGVCGIHLRELEEGRGQLIVFYDEKPSPVVRAQFETYVLDHLQLRALPGTVTSRPVLTCPVCGFAVPDEVVQRRLSRGATTVRCPVCDEAVLPLTAAESPEPTEAAVTEMNRRADEQRNQSVAATRLKGKIQTGDFDVFLCYNSKDLPEVLSLGERLKEQGILPWLDIWEMRPGLRWQDQLQKQIKSIKSAAVLLGPKGTGQWQGLEVHALIEQLVKRKRPIIPVVLATRKGTPRLPPFLSTVHLVDMRKPEPDPFQQLLWGITGDRPQGPGA